MTDRRPARVVHPGEILGEELNARGILLHHFAVKAGIMFPTIFHLVNGSIPITPDLAQKIGAALGTSPELWLNLQKQYDEWKSEK